MNYVIALMTITIACINQSMHASEQPSTAPVTMAQYLFSFLNPSSYFGTTQIANTDAGSDNAPEISLTPIADGFYPEAIPFINETFDAPARHPHKAANNIYQQVPYPFYTPHHAQPTTSAQAIDQAQLDEAYLWMETYDTQPSQKIARRAQARHNKQIKASSRHEKRTMAAYTRLLAKDARKTVTPQVIVPYFKSAAYHCHRGPDGVSYTLKSGQTHNYTSAYSKKRKTLTDYKKEMRYFRFISQKD